MSMTDTTHKQAQRTLSQWVVSPTEVPDLAFICDDCEMVYPPTWNGAFGWPNRCKSCNIRKCKWQRSKVWREGLIRKYIRSGKKILFLTFTELDQHEEVKFVSENNEFYTDEPLPAENSAEKKTLNMIKRWQKFKRTKWFKETFAIGGLWVAECTTRIEDLPNQRDLLGNEITRKVWKIHPHIHCVVISDKINIPMLLSAAAEYGFGSQIDVEEITPRYSDYYGRNETKVECIKRAVNYVTVYMNKEQPVTRSRDTWGELRKECAIIRKEEQEIRDLKRSELSK